MAAQTPGTEVAVAADMSDRVDRPRRHRSSLRRTGTRQRLAEELCTFYRTMLHLSLKTLYLLRRAHSSIEKLRPSSEAEGTERGRILCTEELLARAANQGPLARPGSDSLAAAAKKDGGC
jgi:hypothetical protein